jgi:hypothetical protein
MSETLTLSGGLFPKKSVGSKRLEALAQGDVVHWEDHGGVLGTDVVT